MDEEVRQDDITKAGEVSTVTLRKRCDEYIIILQKLGEQVPQFFIDLQEKKKELELESENVIQQTLS